MAIFSENQIPPKFCRSTCTKLKPRTCATKTKTKTKIYENLLKSVSLSSTYFTASFPSGKFERCNATTT